MNIRLRGLIDNMRQNVWLVPGACVAGAAALSYAAQALDGILEKTTVWYIFGGGPAGARELLSTVASSMMTFTGVVFSVTILVLQLASNQFSPRVLRTFLRDRPTKLTLGLFVGTFVYALLGLRNVRGEFDDRAANVPGLTVWFGVILAVLCVGAFVYFIHHVAQSIRAVNVLQRIGDETRSNLHRLFPEGVGNDDGDDERPRRPEGPPSLVVLMDRKSNVLMSVDEDRLWELANTSDVIVSLAPMVGDFVRQRSPVFEIWGDASRLDLEELETVLKFGPERSMYQDAAFGIRQLVDVAERALSPGINDPTTAVQAIDQLHDLLAILVVRRFPLPYRFDDGGKLRLVLRRPTWSDYVHLAVDEIRHAGATSVQIHRRLRFMLEDLLTIAPAFRRPPIEQQLAMLEASAPDAFERASDVGAAMQPSAQGHGPLSTELAPEPAMASVAPREAWATL